MHPGSENKLEALPSELGEARVTATSALTSRLALRQPHTTGLAVNQGGSRVA